MLRLSSSLAHNKDNGNFEVTLTVTYMNSLFDVNQQSATTDKGFTAKISWRFSRFSLVESTSSHGGIGVPGTSEVFWTDGTVAPGEARYFVVKLKAKRLGLQDVWSDVDGDAGEELDNETHITVTQVTGPSPQP